MSKRSRRGPKNKDLANHRPVVSLPTPSKTAAALAPASKPSTTLSTAEQELQKNEAARRTAMIGFGLCGTVVGLLIGLNHWTEAPSTLTGDLPLTVWLGADLGVLRLDWVRAVMMGLMGLVVGGTLGATLGLRSPRMLAVWVLGGLALTIGMVSTAHAPSMAPAMGTLGWALGATLALRAPIA